MFSCFWDVFGYYDILCVYMCSMFLGVFWIIYVCCLMFLDVLDVFGRFSWTGFVGPGAFDRW